MRMLILTSRFPYPIEKGDKLRIYHQIRHLSKSHEITLVAMSDQEVQEEELAHIQEFCKSVHIFPLRKPGISWALFRAIFSRLPFQVHYFYRKYCHKRIINIVEEEQIQYIYCQLIRMAPYIKELRIDASLDYMDCFSVGMERRAKEANFWQKLLFLWEARRLKAYEEKVFLNFNSHGIISEQDRLLLAGPYTAEVKVVPNGVDLEYFSPSENPAVEYDLVFVGNMGYAPNVIAAKYLATQILPEIQKEKAEATLLLAGARPGKEIQALEKLDGVSVGGWYEDIRLAYQQGRVFLAPLFTGSGQQNKILEAMAMEVACISTPLVNNAIEAEAGEEILLAKNLEEFVDHCLSLLNDPYKRERLAKAGRQFVEGKYSWEKSHQLLDEMLGSSVSISR